MNEVIKNKVSENREETQAERLGRLFEIPEDIIGDEEKLRNYIIENPEILQVPLRDLEGIDIELVLLGKEIKGIDLLFIDGKGLLTLVELKRIGKTAEDVRKVFAQLIYYASILNNKSIDELFEILMGEESPPTDSLKNLVNALKQFKSKEEREWILFNHVYYRNPTPSPIKKEDEEFKRNFIFNLDNMLREGSFRLVLATSTDNISQSLLEMINYENAISQRGRQYVVIGFDKVKISEKTYIIPHLMGAPNLLSSYYYREAKRSKRRTPLTDEEIDSLIKRYNLKEYVEIFDKLAKDLNLKRGRTENGIDYAIARPRRKLIHLYLTQSDKNKLQVRVYVHNFKDIEEKEFREKFEKEGCKGNFHYYSYGTEVHMYCNSPDECKKLCKIIYLLLKKNN